jgi:hypothetical protein
MIVSTAAQEFFVIICAVFILVSVGYLLSHFPLWYDLQQSKAKRKHNHRDKI